MSNISRKAQARAKSIHITLLSKHQSEQKKTTKTFHFEFFSHYILVFYGKSFTLVEI